MKRLFIWAFIVIFIGIAAVTKGAEVLKIVRGGGEQENSSSAVNTGNSINQNDEAVESVDNKKEDKSEDQVVNSPVVESSTTFSTGTTSTFPRVSTSIKRINGEDDIENVNKPEREDNEND